MSAADEARLFLAFWPEECTRLALADCRDAWSWGAGAVPVATERLHLTLHFLGSVSRQRLPALVKDLRVPCRRFTLHLDRTERWRNGIAALVAAVVPQPLLELRAALSDRLVAQGLAVEARRFKPHVTLGRHADDSAPPARSPYVRWQVAGHVLVESRPGAGGYRVLKRYA